MSEEEKIIPMSEIIWRNRINERMCNAEEEDRWLYQAIKNSNENIPYKKLDQLVRDSVEMAVKKRKKRRLIKILKAFLVLLSGCTIIHFVKAVN